jgi:endonuclease-3
MFAFHVDLIRHGREICIARAPRCSTCAMTDICDFFGRTRQLDA